MVPPETPQTVEAPRPRRRLGGGRTNHSESLCFGTRILTWHGPGVGSTPPLRGPMALYPASMGPVSESAHRHRVNHCVCVLSALHWVHQCCVYMITVLVREYAEPRRNDDRVVYAFKSQDIRFFFCFFCFFLSLSLLRLFSVCDKQASTGESYSMHILLSVGCHAHVCCAHGSRTRYACARRASTHLRILPRPLGFFLVLVMSWDQQRKRKRTRHWRQDHGEMVAPRSAGESPRERASPFQMPHGTSLPPFQTSRGIGLPPSLLFKHHAEFPFLLF